LKKSAHTAQEIKKIVAAVPEVLGEGSGLDPGGNVASSFEQPAWEYSQLRRIGANVLGSGVAGGKAMSKEAQIASATERTARAAEELVRNGNRPSAPTPVQVV
ncbi:MAG TPA: hypothetical protein VJ904_01195, partial [Tichowtungia sp.]|nr:hypothetical protein [Tichowtungia sp.]